MRILLAGLGVVVSLAGLYAGCGLDTQGNDYDPGGFVGTSGSGSGSSSSSGTPSIPCTDESMCPADSECATYTCEDGKCKISLVPQGTEVQMGKVVGDCKKIVCTGSGTTSLQDADDDPPPSEMCITKTCSAGEVQSTPVMNGTVCGVNLACKEGKCEGCTMAAQCPKPAECHDVQCVAGGCEYPNLPDGMEVGDNSLKTNCLHSVCSGGNPTIVPDITEVPLDDNDPCTIEVCDANGNETHPPGNNGAMCAPAMDSCYLPSLCDNGLCKPQYIAPGTILPMDVIDGDCQQDACGQMGQEILVPANDPAADLTPTDCTMPVCNNGVGGISNLADGAMCNSAITNKCCAGKCCMNAPVNYCVNGQCCSSGVVCNNVCCGSINDECVANACCPSGKKCGNVCCSAQQSCMNNMCVPP